MLQIRGVFTDEVRFFCWSGYLGGDDFNNGCSFVKKYAVFIHHCGSIIDTYYFTKKYDAEICASQSVLFNSEYKAFVFERVSEF